MLDLTAIEQRANAATPGPWEQAWHAQRKPICLITNGAKFGIYGNAPCDYQHDDDANGDFIAHARQDIPALIARVRELEEALEKYGRHEVRHCPKSSYYGNPSEGPCNCGLDAARGLANAK